MEEDKIKSKKASHVGVVLSFVIFVVFLVFVYLIMEPAIKIQGEKKELLNKLRLTLLDEFSVTLTTVTVKIDVPTTNNCVKLKKFNETLGTTEIGENFVVKDEHDNIITNLDVDQKDVLIERLSTSDNFFKFYNSPGFDEITNSVTPPCDTINEDEYSVVVSKSREIFESQINETIIRHAYDYDSLKEDLYIPLGSEFDFEFTDKNTFLNKTINENKRPTSSSVYAEEIPILYIDGQGNINNGFITIIVW